MSPLRGACKHSGNRTCNRLSLQFIAAAVLTFSFLARSTAAVADELDKVFLFDIQAQPLDKALLQFGAQAHVQLSVSLGSTQAAVQTRTLQGRYSAKDALTVLLVGTGLKYVVHGLTVEIRQASPAHTKGDATSDLPANLENPNPLHLSAHDRPAKQRLVSPTGHKILLQEIVITGSHLLGIGTIASPTASYSRDDISATGVGNIGEFVNQLPENFSETSEMNATTSPAGPGATIDNNVGAVGFDLRGLGVQSTLVLVNGHRLSPGNTDGNFVDVSLLPLSAISRVDVVKDSASAIYGSDAVGGVVNIITNQHFSGVESSVRYGAVTTGGRTETTASGSVGASWHSGGAVLSYEYGDETPLAAASRSFSDQVPGSPFSLLPEQTRHSLYASLTQSLPAGLTGSGFVLYGHRAMEDSYFYAGNNSVLDSNAVDSYTTEVGLEKDFSSGNVGLASVEYSRNDSQHTAFVASPPPQYSLSGTVDGKSQLAAFDLGFSGAFPDPAGRRPVRYAVGAQARDERLSYRDYLAGTRYQPARTIISEYVEIGIPVLSSLTVSTAYRHEHYSDFGETSNPKIGIEWMPISSISLSATYSTAFRAPALFDTNPVPSSALYIGLPDPQLGGVPGTCGFLPPPQVGCTGVLVLYGGNSHLKPETAKSWTGTVAIHPAWLRGLKSSLSFYDVRYSNRINTLDEAYGNPLNALEDETQIGGAVVRRDLTSQQIQEVAQSAGPNVFNYTGVDTTAVTTLVDDRFLNISELQTRGIEIDFSYARSISAATITSELDGARILTYRSRFAPASPSIEALNTAYNPVSLKLRLHESVVVHRWTGSLFANYVGPYSNNLVSPAVPVASWLSFDASVSRSIALDSEAARTIDVTVGCLNIADRAPPFVSNPNYAVNFDGTNASPLGRFVYGELRLVL